MGCFLHNIIPHSCKVEFPTIARVEKGLAKDNGEIFEPLKDIDLFKQVRINSTGTTIE